MWQPQIQGKRGATEQLRILKESQQKLISGGVIGGTDAKSLLKDKANGTQQVVFGHVGGPTDKLWNREPISGCLVEKSCKVYRPKREQPRQHFAKRKDSNTFYSP